MAFSLDACTVQIAFEPESRIDAQVFQQITVKAAHSDIGDVGKLSAVRVIRQYSQGRNFLDIADEHSQDLQMLAFGVFDEHGRVQQKLLKDDGKGTGCWGVELNSGALIHIVEVSVEQDYKGKGIGSLMVKALLVSQYVGPGDHLTCWPLEDNHVSFLRKNGFRRIGWTALFGYSPNPSHPSRVLAADADVDAEAGAQPAA